MMAALRWIIALPVIAASIAFALVHREPVSFLYNPAYPPLEMPLYALVLGGAGIGFVLGALVCWLGLSPQRAELPRRRKEIRTLEHEIETLHDTSDAKSPATPAPAATESLFRYE